MIRAGQRYWLTEDTHTSPAGGKGQGATPAGRTPYSFGHPPRLYSVPIIFLYGYPDFAHSGSPEVPLEHRTFRKSSTTILYNVERENVDLVGGPRKIEELPSGENRAIRVPPSV